MFLRGRNESVTRRFDAAAHAAEWDTSGSERSAACQRCMLRAADAPDAVFARTAKNNTYAWLKSQARQAADPASSSDH